MTADPPTTKLGLYKSDPDGDDLVNYAQDLGGNLDKIDAAMGVTICTSSTRPSVPYVGQGIYEGDTHRFYVWTSGAWTEVVGTAAAPIFAAGLSATRGNPTDVAIATADDGDTQRRFGIRADGRHQWGTGAGAEDTFLYRSGTNALTTDGALSVAGNLTVSGVGSRTFLRKAADTARTTATKSDDPDLTTTITAGQVYELEGLLVVGTTDESGADFSGTLTAPASTGGWVNFTGQATSIASPAGAPLMVVADPSNPGTQTFGAVSSATYAAGVSITISGILVPTATGTFAINWARSGGSGTLTLKRNSFLRLTRVA